MGAAYVVGQVVRENVLCMAPIANQNVVGAASAGPGRRSQGPNTETANALSEEAFENGIAVMDQEAGDLVGVGHGLDQPLSGPDRGRMLCDAEMNQTPPVEGEDDEDVEHA